MKLRLTIAAVLVLLAGSASARTETFSADSADAADGKCRLSSVASGTLKIHGTFGGGTATVRALAEGGDVATAADWVAVSTYTTDTVQRIDFGNRQTLQVTLSGATTPTLVCEVNKG
jgi:hypothetical protein